MELQNNNKIDISDKAADEVRRVMMAEKAPHKVLRVSVVGGGCSGMSYKLSFDEAPHEKDKIFEHPSGLKLVIDPKSFLFLKGMTLDFSDGLNGKGFVFNNPNAKQTCGCGSSFSA